MGLIAILRVAILALARNKMRSVLTMLGIIIGVAAVICSVGVGTGASNQIQQQIERPAEGFQFDVVVHALILSFRGYLGGNGRAGGELIEPCRKTGKPLVRFSIR